MAIKPFDIMNLGKAGLIDPAQAGYRDSLEIIKDESFRIQKSFVKIGWYLKHIRDNELYKEDGYASIYECAADQFGYSQSTVSRFINICEKFSKDHDSPEIDGKYTGFDKSQMIEMLPMEPELLEKVTPDMTVKQIREIKSTNKEKNDTSIPTDDDIPGQTSIEEDFPEYMPEDYPATQEKPEFYEENECREDIGPAGGHILEEGNSIIDGEYHEISEPEEKISDDEAVEMPEETEAQEDIQSDIPKKCTTGWNKYGVCSCCGHDGVKCCIQCQNDCNSRCGWIKDRLPKLKNDIQRKEWLNNYKTWGLWYHDEHINVNYYKFDFIDGSCLVVAEYPQRISYWNGKPSDEYYFHLIEKNKKGYNKAYDGAYCHIADNETYLVDFLKKLQKKES